ASTPTTAASVTPGSRASSVCACSIRATVKACARSWPRSSAIGRGGEDALNRRRDPRDVALAREAVIARLDQFDGHILGFEPLGEAQRGAPVPVRGALAVQHVERAAGRDGTAPRA